MARLHTDGAAAADLEKVRRMLAELSDWLRREGRGDEPLALDALQEAVEASLLGAIVEGTPLPGPAELSVEPEPYLLGLGDTVGEVRRLVLDRLAHDDLAGADRLLRLMERLTHALLRFDTDARDRAAQAEAGCRADLARTHSGRSGHGPLSGRVRPTGDPDPR